jgi:hypothetical protein
MKLYLLSPIWHKKTPPSKTLHGPSGTITALTGAPLITVGRDGALDLPFGAIRFYLAGLWEGNATFYYLVQEPTILQKVTFHEPKVHLPLAKEIMSL